MARILSSKIIRAEQPGDDFIEPLAMEDFPQIAEDIEMHSLSDNGDMFSPEAEKEENTEDIEKKSYEAAFAEGEKAGIEKGRKEVEPVVERLMSFIDEFRLARDKIYNESEDEFVALILAATRKIIQTELAIDRKSVAGVIRNALKSIADRNDILIRVNPKDYFYILEHRKKLFGDDMNFKDIKFMEDNSVGMGGCLIESRHGEVDATIEKQLELLGKALKDA